MSKLAQKFIDFDLQDDEVAAGALGEDLEEEFGDEMMGEGDALTTGGEEPEEFDYDELDDGFDETKKNKLDNMQLLPRSKEDREFEDEVEFDPNIVLAERLKNYRGMRSFRNSVWSKYENISNEVKKITVLENQEMIQKNAHNAHNTNIIAFDGMYVRFRVKTRSMVEHMATLQENSPMIISNLFRYERKVSLLHARVQIHNENTLESLKSKVNYEIHTGFRRFKSNVMFSRIYKNCDKYKYVREVEDYGTWYLASFYGQIYFPPNRVNIFALNDAGAPISFSLSGRLLKPDPFVVILKRIILTGYPLKIHTNSSVIKHMFFHP